MKIVIPTFLLTIGFSAVQAKSGNLRHDEANEKSSQLARRKLRRALQTDSSMSYLGKWLYIALLIFIKIYQ